MRRLILIFLVLFWAGAASAAEQPQYGPEPDWVVHSDPPPADPDADGPLRALLSDLQVSFEGGTAHTYAHVAMKVLTPQGLQAAGNLAFSWRPDTETLTLHYVRILRGGEAIDVLGKGEDIVVARREENLELAMLDGVLTASLQPRGLRVGDVIEFAVTTDRRDPVMQGKVDQFTSNMLSGPTERLVLRGRWPSGRAIRWRTTEGLAEPKITKHGGITELLIEMDDPDPVKIPESAPPRFSNVGSLELTEFASWREISALLAEPYAEASALTADSQLRAEIEKIRAASSDPKTRALMALRLVQDKVRYVFLGMEGGFIPASADETWTRRFGDCKGKSALLVAILHELGIEAEAASASLQNSDGLDKRLPMIEAFDHVIVRAVIGGKTYWLDGARSGDRDLDQQPAAAYRWALPIRAGGADLERMPEVRLGRPQVTASLHIDATAGLSAPAPTHGEQTFTGDTAQVIKGTLENLTAKDRTLFLKRYWKNSYDFIEAEDVSWTYDDPTGTVTLSMDGAAEMEWNGGWYELDGASLGWKDKTEREPGPHEDAPFAINHPVYQEYAETILLPQAGRGFSLVGDADIDKTIAAWRFIRKATLRDGVVTMKASFQSLKSELPAKEFKDSVKPIGDLYGDNIHIQVPANYKVTDADLSAVADGAPKTAEDHLRRGEMLLWRGDGKGALADFEEAARLDPASAEAIAYRGIARLAAEDPEGAAADIEKAIEMDDRNAFGYAGRGAVLVSKQEYRGAIDAYSRALSIDPRYTFARLERARAYLNLADYASAMADVAEALRQNSDDLYARSLRYQVLAAQNKPEEALATADETVAMAPTYPQAYVDRGFALLMLGRRNDAQKAFGQAYGLEPSAIALIGRAQTYRYDDQAKAIADLDEAATLDPESDRPLLMKAGILQMHEDYEGALATLNKLLSSDPENLEALDLRSDVLTSLLRFDQALADADKLLEADPDNAIYLNNRCWLRAVSNTDLDAGLADCDAAVNQGTEDFAIFDSRGWIRLRRGEWDAALADFDEALEINPVNASSLYGRGLVLLHKGRKTEARQELAGAHAQDPEIEARFAAYGIKP